MMPAVIESNPHVNYRPRRWAVAAHKAWQAEGVKCITHRKSETTELAHLLNNSAYGVALMFADEMNAMCRQYGVDYVQAVMVYTDTHNSGFRSLDHERLVRPVLTPPNGRIGGHCVTQGASLIEKEKRGPLMEMLARYNGPESVRDAARCLGVEPQEPPPGCMGYPDNALAENSGPGSSVAERSADNRQAAGSTPAPATLSALDNGEPIKEPRQQACDLQGCEDDD